jgi:phosphatidate cytidylyltransferase
MACFLVLAGGVMFFEWNRLTKQEDQRVSYIVTIVLQIAVLAVLSYFAALAQWANAIAAIFVGAVVTMIVLLPKSRNPFWPLLALPYICLPVLAIIWIRMSPMGAQALLWLLVIIWAADVGGYLFGRTIGGPKLAPKISPNKTWAGILGGLLLAALVGVIAALILNPDTISQFVMMSLMFGVVAQVGDLVESALKRHFGVKDISGMIPGHGGVMDRLDSLIFVVVFAALFGLANDGSVMWWV